MDLDFLARGVSNGSHYRGFSCGCAFSEGAAGLGSAGGVADGALGFFGSEADGSVPLGAENVVFFVSVEDSPGAVTELFVELGADCEPGEV